MPTCLSLVSSVPMKAFLSHPDLLPNDDREAMNTLILKEDHFPEYVGFKEFTMCLRVKILSFKARNVWTTIWSGFDGLEGDGGQGSWITFWLADPSYASAMALQTYVDKVEEIVL